MSPIKKDSPAVIRIVLKYAKPQFLTGRCRAFQTDAPHTNLPLPLYCFHSLFHSLTIFSFHSSSPSV